MLNRNHMPNDHSACEVIELWDLKLTQLILRIQSPILLDRSNHHPSKFYCFHPACMRTSVHGSLKTFSTQLSALRLEPSNVAHFDVASSTISQTNDKALLL
ncbi:unnamed protein product [Calypogeia fissa]